MEPRLREQWYQALVSGDFEQVDSALKRVRIEAHEVFGPGGKKTTTTVETARYCCLGVLGELAKEFFTQRGEIDKANLFEITLGQMDVDDESINCPIGGSTGKFSDEQLQALGLTHSAQSILVSLNDQGAPFNAIASALGDIVQVTEKAEERLKRADALNTENYKLRDQVRELEAQVASDTTLLNSL